MYICMMWHSSHTTKDLYYLTNISKVPKLNCIMSVVGEIVTSLEVALASDWSSSNLPPPPPPTLLCSISQSHTTISFLCVTL